MGLDISPYASMYPYHFKSKHYFDPINLDRRVEWDTWAKRRHEMMNWIAEQRIDHWTEHNGLFMFSFEEDCILFALRWE